MLRIDWTTGEAVFAPSGRLVSKVARVLAPRAAEARAMIIQLRTDFDLSRGQLASLLASCESSVRAWETGRRVPSKPIRRLVSLVDAKLRESKNLDWWELVLWGRK